ncbi:MAG: type I 3-dehydroquinate dehydratase [Ignavibacteriae bacterium]|nr:type I 3-dehydroquinate dehydratase [Ignavibacteriota bacterium]
MEKLCVSIFAVDFDFCIKVVKKYKFVELRLDEGKLTETQIGKIITSGNKIITACRSGFISNPERFGILQSAITNGTTFIDIEHDFPSKYKNKLIKSANDSGTNIILSYHNFEFTPDYMELSRIGNLLSKEADIIKIVCQINKRKDMQNIFRLYKDFEPGKLITFGLGYEGKVTRFSSLLMGSPFTYVSIKKGMETSEGQYDYKEMTEILNKLK